MAMRTWAVDGPADWVLAGCGVRARRMLRQREEQRSEKYRYALMAVVSIGVRAGQLKESAAEKILKKAGGVFGDKGVHRD
jgi:hypothetical protein